MSPAPRWLLATALVALGGCATVELPREPGKSEDELWIRSPGPESDGAPHGSAPPASGEAPSLSVSGRTPQPDSNTRLDPRSLLRLSAALEGPEGRSRLARLSAAERAVVQRAGESLTVPLLCAGAVLAAKRGDAELAGLRLERAERAASRSSAAALRLGPLLRHVRALVAETLAATRR